VAYAVVEEAADQAEDGPLQEQSPRELGVLDLAVLRLRRLLIVDQTPHLLEELLSEQTSQQASQNAHR
jgi:hypothetical protein